MSEQFDLTNPDQAVPGTSTYSLVRLDLQFAGGSIGIELRGSNGERKEISLSNSPGDDVTPPGTEITDLLIALNKANLSTKSLHKRVMEKLIADGLIDGTISGTPD